MNAKNIICSFFCCPILFSYNLSFAQTVTEDAYINDKIDKGSISMDYDDISQFFGDSPAYDIECFVDPLIKQADKYSAEQGEKAFGRYLEKKPFNSQLVFAFQELSYGFNLDVHKVNLDANDKNDLFVIESQVNCSSDLLENQDDKKKCGFLYFSDQKKISVNTNDDEFFPEGTKTEAWKIYYINESLLFASVSLKYAGETKSFLGRKNGTVGYSQGFLCALTKKENE